ncbi:MAG: phosphomannomutase/phosphoglucomutase [Planctomycetes bacterium]|nr:phosphomannomutase/phosphoglucomutase [Planctomycetota bacterium]
MSAKLLFLGSVRPENRPLGYSDHNDEINCPAERSPISYAVCKARQRRHFERCAECDVPQEQQQGDPARNTGQTHLAVFRADGILGIYPDELDEHLARKIGAALSQRLQREPLVVGYDMRSSSQPLAKAARAGINSAGINVVDIGLCSTEIFAFAIANYKRHGGLMVTGGRSPRQYNGFRVCRENASLLTSKSGISNIQAIVERGTASAASVAGRVETSDPFFEYRDHILSFAPAIRKMRIVVDAANGMAAKVAPVILGKTECELVPLNFELDGTFPGHEPDPLNKENLKELRKRVIESGADLGVAFDGDAGRCVFVDEHGETVCPDVITALLTREVLSRENHATIVYDLRSSRVVSEEIRRSGGIPCQVPAGHIHMRAALRKRHGAFAGGPEAHYCFKENFHSDSAMTALLKILGMLTAENKTLSQLVMPLRRYYRTGELEVKVADKDERIHALARHFTNGKINYLDGITVEFENWWFNARKDEVGPFLKVNLEATSPEVMAQAKQTVLDVIEG